MAAPVEWTIPTLPLGSGTFSGTFTYDADTNVYSAVNIVTVGAAPAGAAYVRPALADVDGLSNQMLLVRPTALNAEKLYVYFSSPLTNAGGTVSVGYVYEGVCPEDCVSVTPYRNQVGPGVITGSPVASPVPTLSEWAMILFGTVLAGGAALYLQRRRLAG